MTELVETCGGARTQVETHSEENKKKKQKRKKKLAHR